MSSMCIPSFSCKEIPTGDSADGGSGASPGDKKGLRVQRVEGSRGKHEYQTSKHLFSEHSSREREALAAFA